MSTYDPKTFGQLAPAASPSTIKTQRLATRRLGEARRVYNLSKKVFIATVTVFLATPIPIFLLWMWGYDGRYVHEDRGDVTGVTTIVWALMEIGAVCLACYVWDEYLVKAYRERRDAQYAWEDAMADD